VAWLLSELLGPMHGSRPRVTALVTVPAVKRRTGARMIRVGYMCYEFGVSRELEMDRRWLCQTKHLEPSSQVSPALCAKCCFGKHWRLFEAMEYLVSEYVELLQELNRHHIGILLATNIKEIVMRNVSLRAILLSGLIALGTVYPSAWGKQCPCPKGGLSVCCCPHGC
jgi:hypothetical protein